MSKRNRIIYAILWVLSLVGISFFGGPVSYGFFTLMTLLPVISFLYLLFVSFSFRIYQELEGKNLVAGHTVPFYFILKNEFPFGFSSIRVRFFSDLSDILELDDDEEYELQPKTGIKKNTKVLCKYRGEYEVGIQSIEITDYFCLLKRKFNNKETLRVIVKPAIIELTELKTLNPNGKMTKESAFHPTHPDVLVRRYEEGDDIRFVDWKSSAKSGELMVRKTIGEEREGIGIILPVKRCGKEASEYLPVENKMLESAIALSWFFLRKNSPVSAYLATGTAEKDRKKGYYGNASKEHFHDLYEWYSSVEFRDDLNEESLYFPVINSPEIYRSKMVFFVLQSLDTAAVSAIRKIHGQNIPVVVYYVSGLADELKGRKLPNTEFIQIPPEADLKEVM